MTPGSTPVAIACQGGGSHTAFTAGVLSEVLPALPNSYELVGLSGTSGGAACAAVGWYGLLTPDTTPESLLREFWTALAANTPFDSAANTAIRFGIELQRAGVPVPEISPALSVGSRIGQRRFHELLEATIEFDAVPDMLEDGDPALFVSAIDVRSGTFRVFREDELSTDAILASAAEPHVFQAVEIDGEHYWDGLFAKNPPLTEFIGAADIADPEEIWLISINPQERDHVPTSLDGINDRRNELAGNLSLNAERRFIERVNAWIEEGYLPERYTHTTIRTIPFEKGSELDWRTKLDRDPDFIEELFTAGQEAGRAFLEQTVTTEPAQ